jgi:hypothetical protein
MEETVHKIEKKLQDPTNKIQKIFNLKFPMFKKFSV